MATTRYTVIDGEILSENRAGVKRDYVPDPLGSTLALLDNTQTQTDTFSYYPYGEVASRTGTTATPFQYIGTLGYYQDNSGRTYVRARYLRTAHGRWMTQDPIGFRGRDFNLYRYAYNSPTSNFDITGLKPTTNPGLPSFGQKDCKSLGSPGACFRCAFDYYWLERDLDPKVACTLSKRYCGSHVDCDAKQTPTPPPSPPVCSVGSGGKGGFLPWIPPVFPPAGVASECCQFACQIIAGGYDYQCAALCRNWRIASKSAAGIPCTFLAEKCPTLQQPLRELCTSVWIECC